MVIKMARKKSKKQLEKEKLVQKLTDARIECAGLEKELDVLIDARGVFSGGIDISDTLIQRLNANGMK